MKIQGLVKPKSDIFGRKVENLIRKKKYVMQETKTFNVAFFDAEFTARTDEDRGIQEMIQCAFVIYEICADRDNNKINMSDDPIFTYESFVKPKYTPMLSEYIKSLTGISQKDVDNGKAFDEAMGELCLATKQYKVQKIFTWGPDRTVLKNNCSVVGYDAIRSRIFLGKMHDVSRELSDMYGYDMIVSQHKMCQHLGIKEIGEKHDAYSDAINLSKIVREFCEHFCL